MHQGYLLPWHRVFVWSYEEALRNECGYSGYQPYWEWSKHSDDQSQSPLFDGSETSISGNGLKVPQTSINYTVPGLPVPIYLVRNPGTGGGCVHDGPFANFTVNLGPVAPNPHPNPEDPYGLRYNPRCLRRDFSPNLSQAALTYKNVTDLLQSPDIHIFRPLLERSMHPLAHATIGGELSDLFTSPGDPAFFFLHSQVDRLWSIWQSVDYKTRTDGLDGTRTFHNGKFLKPPYPSDKLVDQLFTIF
jgi:tyrosinase